MGRIFCIIGKSSSGKDTIYKKLLKNPALGLRKIVPYTTRPIREGERDGEEYHFSTGEELERLRKEGKIIECRSYDTIYGIWYYFMVKDERINLEKEDYIIIGTLQSYQMTRNYFGSDKVVPIYIELEDGERLSRALRRERRQREPKYEEMCRRFLADCRDFSPENLREAGIDKIFYNHSLKACIEEIIEYIV